MVETEQINEIAALMQGEPIAPDEPAEERTVQPESEPEEVQQVADGDTPEQSPAEPEAEETQAQPLTVKSLAEKLEMSAKDLYAELELVPGMTLGQAKDSAKDLLRAKEMLAEVEDKRITSENELISKQQEYQLALENPGMTQGEIEQRHAATVKAANQQAIDTIDGWADVDVRNADLKAIHGLLKEYGYSVAQADSVIDPTQLKMLTDYSRLRARVKASAKPIKQSQKQNRGNSITATKTTANKAVDQYRKGEISQNAAVTALINS